ncbi:(d)CMP kinase [Candidatus Finniella inopinata]|uniref:Cytidylate kinase n=1 Tax=Candidatus Finniella inopinata TaxID=1696036 RepID=A0A4Q7DHG1_9PROT|nr:(d)CMP kinase [Candidatus Finniella inopinata]RZI46193.1 (d)CMP kinase [Candidatus Finniella inopinata]
MRTRDPAIFGEQILKGEEYIVAIDGPAGAGKGTVAKYLATYYRLKHLDTGLLYRLLGYKANEKNVPFDNLQALMHVAATLDFNDLQDPRLRDESVGNLASQISVFPEIRQFLTSMMRRFCQDIAPPYQGAVLDGRDIGTVVCPDAHLKLFVTADPKVRAQRRNHEMVAKGSAFEEQDSLSKINERDQRDQNRAAAPLVMAGDAHLIDTTNLSIEQACEQAGSLLEQVLPF